MNDHGTADRKRAGFPSSGGARIAGGLLAVLMAAGAAGATPATNVSAETSLQAAADTSHLASGPYSSMQTLLEKTLFQVNVVDLTLRYDSAAAARIRRAVEGREYSNSLADTVAVAVIGARNVNAHLDFRRDLGLDRFLESVRSNMVAARDAGMLADSAFQRFAPQLPEWYSALEGRGVKDGDVIRYRIRSDSLWVVYRSAEGDTLIDRTDVGEQHRRAVIGGYLAPDVAFREGLVRSLFERGGNGS